MKLLTAAMLVTLALTTGFTCSKNNPPEAQTEQAPPPPAQDQMGAPADATAAPADATTTAPAEGTANQ